MSGFGIAFIQHCTGDIKSRHSRSLYLGMGIWSRCSLLSILNDTNVEMSKDILLIIAITY